MADAELRARLAASGPAAQDESGHIVNLDIAGTAAREFFFLSFLGDTAPGATRFSFDADGILLNGQYANQPSLSLTAPARQTAYFLRGLSLRATLAPGLDLELARWQTPLGANQWDWRPANAYGLPLLAAPGLHSHYAGFGNSGNYIGASVTLLGDLRLHFGRASSSIELISNAPGALPYDFAASLGGLHTAQTNTAGLDWNFADWGGIGLSASQGREMGSLLSSAVSGPIRAATAAETTALGISARVGFGGGWVTTFAYNEGVTQLNLSSNGIVTNFDPVRSQAFGFAVAKRGLFGNDVLGMTVSRPLQNFAAGNLSVMLTPSPDSVLGVPTPTFAPVGTDAKEADFELGYVTTFMDGALALQANAAYQLNANGDQGQDAVSVLSRARIQF
ncbi:MAG: hypothetical protein IH888_11005 [Planctomycetes bacterium]|nr:hypothetical protein [Planctomycetota bacterium]